MGKKEKRTCKGCAYLGSDCFEDGQGDIVVPACWYFSIEEDGSLEYLDDSLKRPEWCPGWFEEQLSDEEDQ